MEDQSVVSAPVAPSSPMPAAGSRSTCTSCGSPSAPTPGGQSQAILIGTVTAAFPSLSVEKEFAQLLNNPDFKGLTDRQTMYAVLSKPENRYLARRMCFMHTPYGSGSSPSFVLLPEERDDLPLLIDTLKRPVTTEELDVAKGRIVGIAPPALCNAQQLPILSFYHLSSFPVEAFLKAIPRPEKIPAKEFHAAAEEMFYRIIRTASNATGPNRALAYAGLSYAALYKLIAEKFNDNASLSEIRVASARSDPDRSDVRLKFIRRDTGFSETFCFSVNTGGQFEYLEEALHPCFEAPIS